MRFPVVLSRMRQKLSGLFTSGCLVASVWLPDVVAADQPQWGEAWSRNMVSTERSLPDSFDPKTGRNIKWTARLGTQSHSTPIVAGGHVYIGTNNGEPRDPKHQGDRGVFMCFDERTGQLLWQLVVPKRDEDAFMDWPNMGMSSTATVESGRVYLLYNRGAVLCLDAKGMANGNDGPFRDEAIYLTPPSTNGVARQQIGAETHPETLRPPANGKLLQPGPLDADILWKFDLVAEAGIWPHDAAHSSILIHGNYLYLNTANGVDNTHKRIRAPDAPSLVVLDKRTGRLVARDDEHIAPNVFHNTWAAPSLARVKGRPLVFFCGGNGIVYAFKPLRKSPPPGEVLPLEKVFQFDFDPTAPKTDVHKYSTNRRESPSNLYGMPVFQQNRLYVAGGGDIWWGKNEAWLKCIDVTALTRPDGHPLPSVARGAGGEGLVWTYPLEKHVLSTVAVYDGLVFIADCGRTFHCVNAKTGQPFWTHEIKGEVWASPYVADGKVYLGTRSGNFYVFAADRVKKVLAEFELGNPISATTTAANGVLYVATMSDLFAVQSDVKKK
jgi:outer membrane protein assembly factor BamB